MGIEVVAYAEQCYYSIDPKIAEAAHRIANEGVVEYCARKPDRFVGLGVVTLQEPELAVRELEYVMGELKLKGVEILTNVDGQELSDPKFRPFFVRAEQLGAFIMMHPNGFTHGERLTHFYFNNVLGNPLDTTLALHNLIFSGTLARFPELKLMAVHGGGFLPGCSGRIDHAWRPAGLPRQPAAAADHLSPAGLSRHRRVQLSPAGIYARPVRTGPYPDGHRLPL
jgi:aminocarboxymuconate-semialdehyde decarboxylase